MDFSNLLKKNKAYAGANGGKISVEYNGELYMIKFPSTAKLNNEMSYANGCVSEYLGCHIFNLIGVKAQETILGTYEKNNKQKIVVACKDFTSYEMQLQDFASLKNTIIDSEHNGYGTELNDIIDTIEKQDVIDCNKLKEHFWDTFIIDALIGNWDRHNGNWGY